MTSPPSPSLPLTGDALLVVPPREDQLEERQRRPERPQRLPAHHQLLAAPVERAGHRVPVGGRGVGGLKGGKKRM